MIKILCYAVILFSFPACAEPYHGIASWYNNDKLIESRKKIAAGKYSAAHRTLRLGTLLKLTNVKNGKTIEAVVNDRGPNSKKIELDVSKQAAEELGFLRSGTAKLLIEVKK